MLGRSSEPKIKWSYYHRHRKYERRAKAALRKRYGYRLFPHQEMFIESISPSRLGKLASKYRYMADGQRMTLEQLDKLRWNNLMPVIKTPEFPRRDSALAAFQAKPRLHRKGAAPVEYYTINYKDFQGEPPEGFVAYDEVKDAPPEGWTLLKRGTFPWDANL